MLLVGLMISACSQQAVTSTTSVHPPLDPAPYIIGVNDVLEVVVWRQPQLSGKITVEEDGSIAVPLAGRVPAAGVSCQTLEKTLYAKLVPFIHDPRVTVRVSDPRSKVFYVIGEVKKPGVMRLVSGEVLSQGLAEAGGFTDFANRRAIKIVRRGPTEDVKITINYDRIEKGDLAADIPLQPGDTITVP